MRLLKRKKKNGKTLSAIMSALAGIAHNQEVIYLELLEIKKKLGDDK